MPQTKMNNVTDQCGLDQRSQTIVNQTTDRDVFDSQEKDISQPDMTNPALPFDYFFRVP